MNSIFRKRNIGTNVIRKCFASLIFIVVFATMTLFIQLPVISWFNQSRISLPATISGAVFRIILLILLTLLSLYFLLLFAKKFGIVLNPFQTKMETQNKRTLLTFIAITLPVTLVYIVALFIGNNYSVGEVPTQILNAHKQPIVFLLFLSTGILTQPLLEEILFRGILQNKLSRYSPWLAILITSIIFSYIHGEDTILNTHLISSVVYGLSYERTNDIKVPIILHMSQNLLVFLCIIFLG